MLFMLCKPPLGSAQTFRRWACMKNLTRDVLYYIRYSVFPILTGGSRFKQKQLKEVDNTETKSDSLRWLLSLVFRYRAVSSWGLNQSPPQPMERLQLTSMGFGSAYQWSNRVVLSQTRCPSSLLNLPVRVSIYNKAAWLP